MRTLLVAASIVLFSACSAGPVSPAGVYRLGMEDKLMVLQVRTGGDYVLQIDGLGRNPDEIRGRWEEGQGDAPHLVLHGLLWRDTEPEAGRGAWAARLNSDAELCLDSESQACFAKDKES